MVSLTQYKKKVGQEEPISVLSDQPGQQFITGFGFSGDQMRRFEKIALTQDATSKDHTLIMASTKNGQRIEKTFIFSDKSYVINVQTKVVNNHSSPWKGSFYTQFFGQSETDLHAKTTSYWGQIKAMWHRFWGSKPTPKPQDYHPGHPAQGSNGVFGLRTYTGAAYHSQDKPYVKFPYDKMSKAPLNKEETGGWVAIQNHYFITAWVPNDQNKTLNLYSHWQDGYATPTTFDQTFALGYRGAPLTIAPGQTVTRSEKLYVGPEIANQLKTVGPDLDLTIDYGWLWFVSSALFWVLSLIHTWVPNWGLTIIVMTILVKLVFYRLSASAYRSMAKTRQLQPRLQAIQKRYEDDPQQKNQAMMALYREEKVNPMSGCFPMVIQFPFMLGLYYVFMESIELRHASFLWISDLSSYDPWFVMPALMGASMWLQQQLSPTPPDPAQAKMMNILPLFMTVMFAQMPAGLVLYWLTQNVLSFAQQLYVTKSMGVDPFKDKNTILSRIF